MYTDHALSAPDRLRVQQVRAAKAELDWRVSRALLAEVRAGHAPIDCTLALSHSAGHALCGQTAAGVALGVDLERLRPRAIAPLASWVCDASEREALARLGHDQEGQLAFFYLLWTLKEAFIKAANLRFPAAMRTVGLHLARDAEPVLNPPAGRWQARAFRLAPDWMAAVVWRDDPCDPWPAASEVIWHAGPQSTLPDCQLVGAWAGEGAAEP
jgi:4'-phosphopantetheinyl transferase